ncbi:MAG: nitrilase family protein [Flavobacteriales bacterium]|nr:nitrilase family protein [Flavobacteriales bacterium]
MKPAVELKIALLQLELVWENSDANIAAIDTLMGDPQLNSDAYDLLVLPEMWATGFTMNPLQQGLSWNISCAHSPETWPEPLQAMQRWSRQHNAAVVGSLSCNLLDENRCVNRCFFMTPDGLAGWYDKRYLFRFAGEDDSYSPGKERVVIPWRGWNILLQICYDLRFPESSRNDDNSPYDLALYVANWPEVRASAWKTLLKARAIENQAYVAGVNRIGVDANGINHNGLSAIHHPKGQTSAASEFQETHWVCATLSKAELTDYRSRFPVLKDVL